MLADIVDIGGECFNLTGASNQVSPENTNTTRTYDLVCKSRKEFNQTFGSILGNDGLRLIRTYLPYQEPQLVGLQGHDKGPLRNIVEKRMSMIQLTLSHSNHTIKNMQFNQYYRNLKELLTKIDNAEATPSVVSVNKVKKRILDNKFTKEKVYYLLMELAYSLLHPESIKTNADSWMKLLDTTNEMSLGDLVKSIHEAKKDRYDISRIDVDRVANATVLDNSLSVPDGSVEMKRRLEAILKLFVTKQYLQSPVLNDDTVTTLEKRLPQSMSPSQMGGSLQTFEIDNGSVAQMMEPYYQFFTEKYDPIASLLSTDVPADLGLISLAKLLFICQKIIANSQHGIYRIIHSTNDPRDHSILPFLRTQLGAIQAYIADANRTDDERAEFVEKTSMLPAVSITSLLNKFGKSGHYTDPDTLSSINVMIKGINVESHTSTEKMTLTIKNDRQKDAIHSDAMTFFNVPDAFYLVCNTAKADVTPMKVFEIDYTHVNVSKNKCTIDHMTSNPFNKFKEPPLFLENVMNVQKMIIYNHSMLALSMFLLSKQLLPQ